MCPSRRVWDYEIAERVRQGEGKTLVRLYQCPMLHHARCRAGITILEGPGYVQMDICGSHNKTIHTEGKRANFCIQNKNGVEIISCLQENLLFPSLIMSNLSSLQA